MSRPLVEGTPWPWRRSSRHRPEDGDAWVAKAGLSDRAGIRTLILSHGKRRPVIPRHDSPINAKALAPSPPPPSVCTAAEVPIPLDGPCARTRLWRCVGAAIREPGESDTSSPGGFLLLGWVAEPAAGGHATKPRGPTRPRILPLDPAFEGRPPGKDQREMGRRGKGAHEIALTSLRD